MQLRALHPETDFAAAVELINTYNSEPASVEQFAGWMRRMPPGRDIQRWVVEDENAKVLAYGYADHETWFPPDQYEVWAVVAPDRRGQGAGKALFAHAIEYARGQDARLLKTEVRETDTTSYQFVQRFGFVLDRRQFESTLDLTTFDESRFRDAEKAVAASGIRICSLAELGNTEENRRKLHAVNYATALDIPGSSGRWVPFEEFEQTVSNAVWFRPEGQLGALDGEEWIGLSAVQLIPETEGSYNLMTGVMPAYRGRGIALALKLAAIRYARAHGAKYLRTNNDSQNGPMLAVNRKLGYVPQPGIYLLSKKFE
jgi:GNAT superfamily N-acetyltransferase